MQSDHTFKKVTPEKKPVEKKNITPEKKKPLEKKKITPKIVP